MDVFLAEGAQQLSGMIPGHVQILVNRLSETECRVSVRFAEAEVARAAARLRDVLQQIRVFRDQKQSLDLAASAQMQIVRLGTLKMQIIAMRAEIAVFGRTVDDNSPAKASLRRRAEALIGTLVIRETRPSVVTSRFGYLWAIITPSTSVAILVAIFSIIGRHPPSG